MKLFLLACAGGAIGAGARLLVNQAFATRGLTSFPWATLTVNVVGAFLMGVVMTVVMQRFDGSPELRTFLSHRHPGRSDDVFRLHLGAVADDRTAMVWQARGFLLMRRLPCCCPLQRSMPGSARPEE